jgi:hypothetical protein
VAFHNDRHVARGRRLETTLGGRALEPIACLTAPERAELDAAMGVVIDDK